MACQFKKTYAQIKSSHITMIIFYKKINERQEFIFFKNETNWTLLIWGNVWTFLVFLKMYVFLTMI